MRPRKVDGASRRIAVSKLIATDGQNPPVLDDDRLTDGESIVDRNDPAVEKHQVGGRPLRIDARRGCERSKARSTHKFTSGETHKFLSIGSEGVLRKRT